MTAPANRADQASHTGTEVALDRPRWTRGDIFRAALFGTLGVIYAILLLPITVIVLVLWAVGKLLGQVSPGSDQTPKPAP
jgi:hypothetical protein